jgi:hypothetical protein
VRSGPSSSLCNGTLPLMQDVLFPTALCLLSKLPCDPHPSPHTKPHH